MFFSAPIIMVKSYVDLMKQGGAFIAVDQKRTYVEEAQNVPGWL